MSKSTVPFARRLLGRAAAFLKCLRAPVAPGSVPSASPGGEDAGASACTDAPVILGGQGRDLSEVATSAVIAAVCFTLGMGLLAAAVLAGILS